MPGDPGHIKQAVRSLAKKTDSKVRELPDVAAATGGVADDSTNLIGKNGKVISFGFAPHLGFSVDPKLFDRPELELTHVNLNDGTVEGFRHRELPVTSVQYHPKASPGPHDSHYLFGDFVEMMRKRRK